MNTNQNREKLFDHRFNVLSFEQYLKDLEEMKFSKICMTEVMNADMMIATFGEEQYYKTCTEILARGNEGYRQMGLDNVIYVYINTYKHFMSVANDSISDEEFLKLSKFFHEQYELSTAKQTEKGGVSRFVVAFGDNLVDKAKSAYYLNKSSQINFIVATDERERLLAEETKYVKMFELLNYAITNDKVVPFYQGIYNNKLEKITKYEALMRVYDQEGNLCPPGVFLDAAKKLKLYLPLSKIMMDKSMRDFENIDCDLGLNISLYDIQSQEFVQWFIERIKKHPNPSQIVIEFVETENYNNNTQLKNFLQDVKSLGCKIAVDDFGVGYATYSSIVSLKPDVIKVDGDIIKHLATNNDSRLILESICYMAKLINSKIVAEFVENEDIQNVIMEYGVDFSQGYYFAKPEKFSDINI